jgi:hypothetical protein
VRHARIARKTQRRETKKAPQLRGFLFGGSKSAKHFAAVHASKT